MPMPTAACLIYFRKVHEAREVSCMEMQLKIPGISLQVWRGLVSGNHQGGAKSVSQVHRDIDMMPTCTLWQGGLSKGTLTSTSTSLGRKLLLQLSPCFQAN